MTYRTLIILGIACLFFACQQSSTVEAEGQAIPVFFDLKQYFTQEIKRMSDMEVSFRKTAYAGDRAEEKEFDVLNLEQEFQIFINSNINKASWQERYSGDTTFANNKIQSIHYKALEESLKTRSIDILYQNEVVKEIEVKNEIINPANSFEQLLIYQPNEKYSITSNQDNLFDEPKKFKIEVEILK